MFLIFIIFLKTCLSQCPSWYRDNDASTGCWEYDQAESKCQLANPACGSVHCGQAWISSELRPDVFGLSGWDLEMHADGVKKLSANGDECSSITWDAESNLFRVNTTLTDCNMHAEQIMVNSQSYWSFQHTIERPEDWLFGRRTSMNVSVGLECRYPSTIVASSASFTGVNNVQDKMIQFDTQIPTVIAHDVDLLDPESTAYTQAVATVRRDLMSNFQGDIQPLSVEVIEFVFNTVQRRSATTDEVKVDVVVRFFFPNPSNEDEPTDATPEVVELKEQVAAVLTVMANDEENTFIEPEFKPVVADLGLTVIENIHFGNFVGYGNMNSGFKLQIYLDPEYLYPVERILMGRTIFVKTDWTSALTKMKFYINDCSYHCPRPGTDEIDSIYIVKDTCYASVVETRITTPNNRKVVSDTASFSFKSFIFEKAHLSKDPTCKLECTIDTCLTGVLCLPPLECDTEGVEYMEYTPLGYGH